MVTDNALLEKLNTVQVSLLTLIYQEQVMNF